MKPILTAIALAALVTASDSALAGSRPPNADERAAIESALQAAGYTRWGKIEFDDDGYWEIDDAVAADGKRYDVDLDLKTYKILKSEIDTD